MRRLHQYILGALVGALAGLCLFTVLHGPAQQMDETPGTPSVPDWTKVDQWPDNEFTRLVPTPEFGTVYSAAQEQDPESDFFVVLFRDVRQEDAEGYIQALKAADFLPAAEQRETPEGGSLVITSILKKGDVGVSLSYSGDTMALYIALPQRAK